jgi:hypothetical protein
VKLIKGLLPMNTVIFLRHVSAYLNKSFRLVYNLFVPVHHKTISEVADEIGTKDN